MSRSQADHLGRRPAERRPSRPGIFIEVEVDEPTASDADMAVKLEEVCPVNIYADEGGRVTVVRENLDECVLCRLCIEAAPRARSTSASFTTAPS